MPLTEPPSHLHVLLKVSYSTDVAKGKKELFLFFAMDGAVSST